MSFHLPEKYRITAGLMGSTRATSPNGGAFFIPPKRKKEKGRSPMPLACIASCEDGWEHVSVSLSHRCPVWVEMCWVKDKFWDVDDVVIQLHVQAKDHINNHPYCLHMWRKAGTNDFIGMPPKYMV